MTKHEHYVVRRPDGSYGACCDPATDGSALDVWDNLPPHLQEALRGALEGLSEAFEDHAHPFSPALQALWDVTDQIEAYALAQEQAVDTSGSTAVRSVEEHAAQETFGPRE